ncbi:MAG: ABC transporter substrate-binding protein [Cetobacterium sp.]|uniref:ABC transporter substrate-binding protein n=1 Tax=Cetobacterium sp. TaxID=2071632 RepID=UPI002FCC4933
MKKIFLIFIATFSLIFSKEPEKGKVYKRIVVYNMSVAEILYKIGAGDSIIAIGDHKGNVWPEEKVNLLPLAGSTSKPQLEKIISFNPDLVIFNVMGNCSEELERMDIPSVVITAKSLDDIKSNIEILGSLTGHEKESISVLEEIDEKLKRIEALPKIGGTSLVLYSKSPLTAFNRDSLPSQALEKIGIQSIIPAGVSKALISQEFVLKNNPDYIIGTLGIKDDLVEEVPILKETKAYEKDNIFLIDSLVILRASHRIFDEIFNLYEQITKR